MTHEELCRMEQSQLIKLIDEGKLAQVVRCKDCTHWKLHYDNNHYCNHYPYSNLYVITEKDDYCSYGQKKR